LPCSAAGGEIRILGRAKDTIVLLGGENVEPLPMEDKMRESMYVGQAVALGQDQKFLGALIVPDEENVKLWAKEQGLEVGDYAAFVRGPEVHELIKSEIAEAVSTKNGFKTWERIARFAVVPGPFEVGKELSGKQEIKRHVINEIYKKGNREDVRLGPADRFGPHRPAGLPAGFFYQRLYQVGKAVGIGIAVLNNFPQEAFGIPADLTGIGIPFVLHRQFGMQQVIIADKRLAAALRPFRRHTRVRSLSAAALSG
jgi:hypothetical protein